MNFFIDKASPKSRGITRASCHVAVGEGDWQKATSVDLKWTIRGQPFTPPRPVFGMCLLLAPPPPEAAAWGQEGAVATSEWGGPVKASA